MLTDLFKKEEGKSKKNGHYTETEVRELLKKQLRDSRMNKSNRLIPRPYETDFVDFPLKALFPDSDKVNLAAVSEIPARMILPLLRLIISEQALIPLEKRGKPLSEIFRREFYTLMIGKDRRGRTEILILGNQNADPSGFGGQGEQQLDMSVGR